MDAEPILALAGEQGISVTFKAKDKKFVVVEVANNETLRGGVSNHDTTETPNIGVKRVLDRLDREPSQEPTELTFRQFCEHYGIEVPDGTSNQPSKAVVLTVIAQVEAMGHYGWSWKSERKRLIREK